MPAGSRGAQDRRAGAIGVEVRSPPVGGVDLVITS
jgi:hypothetical protein